MISDACQCGKMVTLLNLLFFVFNILFLPINYRVNYCKACDWCVSLDIALK